MTLVEGRHWTTDALYRETFGKVARLAGVGGGEADPRAACRGLAGAIDSAAEEGEARWA